MSIERLNVDEASGIYRRELLSEEQLERSFEDEEEPYLAWARALPDELLLHLQGLESG